MIRDDTEAFSVQEQARSMAAKRLEAVRQKEQALEKAAKDAQARTALTNPVFASAIHVQPSAIAAHRPCIVC